MNKEKLLKDQMTRHTMSKSKKYTSPTKNGSYTKNDFLRLGNFDLIRSKVGIEVHWISDKVDLTIDIIHDLELIYQRDILKVHKLIPNSAIII